MTRRQRRKLFGLPGIAPFTVTDPLGDGCASCGWPLDRGDVGRWDDRWEVLTCSDQCAGNARAHEIRKLEEWEAEQRREAKRPTPLVGDLFGYDHGPIFDGCPGS